MIPLPPGWKETFYDMPCFGGGPYGYYWRDRKEIVIYSPAWLSGWRLKLFVSLTQKHERGHAWGIVGCWKPWCLMFEAMKWRPQWKDAWWEKLAGLIMLFNGFRFCGDCRKWIP
ncbi:MAG: hypothetical protein ABIL06_16245 [Pseudomonadota bacterium]